MSIYGPPTRPPGRTSRPAHKTAEARAGLKLALWLTGVIALIGITVAAYASFMAREAMTRELKSAESARRDAKRALEAAGLETAERLPPIERPALKPLHSLTAEDLLRPPAARPADGPPAKLQTAELLAPPAAEPVTADPPAKLQSAELIP